MNKYIESINFLISKKTQNIPHGQDNLFQHSVNVYNKLRLWKCNEDICFAGLFNSIYDIEKDKDVIRNIIGTKSENLIKSNDKIISLADKLVKTYIEIIDGDTLQADDWDCGKLSDPGAGSVQQVACVALFVY